MCEYPNNVNLLLKRKFLDQKLGTGFVSTTMKLIVCNFLVSFSSWASMSHVYSNQAYLFSHLSFDSYRLYKWVMGESISFSLSQSKKLGLGWWNFNTSSLYFIYGGVYGASLLFSLELLHDWELFTNWWVCQIN